MTSEEDRPPARSRRSTGARKHPEPPSGPKAPNPRRALGIEGEVRAALYLEARGYRIVARNVRAERVEIDLVARRGRLIVFVEVKSRRSGRYGSPASAVDERKQRRLRRGARAWLARDPIEARGWRRLRFDVVTCLAPGRSESTRRGESGAPNKTTAPERARWQFEHWEGAF